MADLSDAEKKAVESITLYFDGKFERFISDKALTNETHDLEKMREMVTLAKSENVQDRLRCLNLIGESSDKFPYGFEENILIALRADTNDEVKEKAQVVTKKQRIKTFQEIGKRMGSIHEVYGRIFKNNSALFNATSMAFSQSQAIAKFLPSVINHPIRSINPGLMEELSRTLKVVPQTPFIQSIDPATSPIFAIQSIIQPILRRDHLDQTIGESLGKSSEQIISELKTISSTDEDIVFNYEGYRLLYDLERFLRDLIHQRICIPFRKTIQNKIHPDLLKKWKDRRQEEEKNPLNKNRYRLLDYSDFSDLKDILLKGRNKEEFKDLLNDEQMRNLISKLDELDPIRKKIAHSRSLSKEEFDRLQMYADDVDQLFNPTQSSSGAKS